MLQVKPYDLPDVRLLNDDFDSVMTWVPDQNYIVLGASNRPEEALHLDEVMKDGLEVLQRRSGGQTVFLSPNTVVIAVHRHAYSKFQPKQWFDQINLRLIDALEACCVRGLSLRGISDIAFDDKKIVGSAMYHTPTDVLYHAVLNVSEPAMTFQKYLAHPTKEPDYRQGRSHETFVTSLRALGCTHSSASIASMLLSSLQEVMDH